MQGLKDETIIVTGGGGGIGSATCRRLAREGAKVAVFDRNLEAAQKVVAEITAAGGQAAVVDEVPVLGPALPGGVLAHGRHADAVGQHHAAQREGFEEMGHGGAPPPMLP